MRKFINKVAILAILSTSFSLAQQNLVPIAEGIEANVDAGDYDLNSGKEALKALYISAPDAQKEDIKEFYTGDIIKGQEQELQQAAQQMAPAAQAPAGLEGTMFKKIIDNVPTNASSSELNAYLADAVRYLFGIEVQTQDVKDIINAPNNQNLQKLQPGGALQGDYINVDVSAAGA